MRSISRSRFLTAAVASVAVVTGAGAGRQSASRNTTAVPDAAVRCRSPDPPDRRTAQRAQELDASICGSRARPHARVSTPARRPRTEGPAYGAGMATVET